MSSKSHIKKADTAATEIISEYQQQAIGRAESFSIEEPSDSLRRRLMISQKLPGHITGVSTNEIFISSKPIEISLIDAMQIAARNSRKYQAAKERVFSDALSLDLTRSAYRNSYSGLISSLSSSSGSGSEADRSTASSASGGIKRTFQTGATLSSKIALDLVKLLTMDKTSTFGILADASISIPLLRGAGKDIARERLTQAERDMIYSMWNFERFKKEFAIGITSQYLRTLELQKNIENAMANYKSIAAARERFEALAKAGRTSQTEVDQASQNELRAKNDLISTVQTFEQQLDSLKIELGIPVDARIKLDESDLLKLTNETVSQIEDQPALSPADAEKQANEYILTALSNRLDLLTVRYRHEDARRSMNVAKDGLDPEFNLTLSASTRQTSISGGTPTVGNDGTTHYPSDKEVSFSDTVKYGALLEMDLPWDKTYERIAFRKSLISLRQAERDIEAKEDAVKQELRSSARRIAELKETYLIQEQAVALAERRVESTELFLQAGKLKIRDLLEAQTSLVSAQDNLISAAVSYHLAMLGLQKDLELLEVNEKGLWRNE